MAKLDRIQIFPIKALDGVELDTVEISPGGALKGDRTYAMLDAKGKYINGKNNAKVHLLRSGYNLDIPSVTLQSPQEERSYTFDLQRERSPLEAWLSQFFQQPVTLVEDRRLGFPDDTEASGPTVVSTATLEATATWFPGLSSEQMRQRLRTNLELSGVEAFWEDRLYGNNDETVAFQIGDVALCGINPCQRCIVPVRDPQSAIVYPDFQKIFSRRRQESLPQWVDRSRYNHYYRLCVNTWIDTAQVGKVLRVGDRVELRNEGERSR